MNDPGNFDLLCFFCTQFILNRFHKFVPCLTREKGLALRHLLITASISATEYNNLQILFVFMGIKYHGL